MKKERDEIEKLIQLSECNLQKSFISWENMWSKKDTVFKYIHCEGALEILVLLVFFTLS